jgi:type VI protein secretion system component Hcp
MAEKQSDLLMKLVTASGQGVAAGGTSTLRKDDKLLFDFWAGKFFEVEDFGLGLELNDFETAGTANTNQAQQAAVAPAKFASWRDLRKTTAQIKDIKFPVDMEPFSFSRLIDRASPLLFENCANSISFASATLVKRKVTGQSLALQAFLRLDFKDVLMVGISWDDGDIIKEKCKFICRGVTVQYRRQASDGSLAAAASAEWEQKMALRVQQN